MTIDALGNIHDASGRFSGTVNTSPSGRIVAQVPRHASFDENDEQVGSRPLRRYLALHEGDRAVLAAAGTGSRMALSIDQGRGDHFAKMADGTWMCVESHRDLLHLTVDEDEMWRAALEHGGGRLTFRDQLFSDATGVVKVRDVDQAITPNEFRAELGVARYGRVVSRWWSDADTYNGFRDNGGHVEEPIRGKVSFHHCAGANRMEVARDGILTRFAFDLDDFQYARRGDQLVMSRTGALSDNETAIRLE